MAALITSTDITNELQISLPVGYTAGIITGICDDADAELQCETFRTSFTGLAARRAKRAELLLAIDYLTLSNRDLIKNAIQSMSEDGKSITFNNGRTITSYRDEAKQIIASLKLPATPSYGITVTDIEATHTGTEYSILYGENDTDLAYNNNNTVGNK